MKEFKEKQNKRESCSFPLCEEEITNKVVFQIEDKEFELKPSCDFHLKQQLDLIWKEDEEDIGQIEKDLEKKDKFTRKWLEVAEKVVLERRLNRWEKLQRRYQPLREMIAEYVERLRNKKNKLELELYSC